MRKFQMPVIPPTTSKSIRFPNDMIDRIENTIAGKSCTFSAFVIEAVRTILDDVNDE